MRRNFLPVLGLLSLFVLGSCSAERDPKIASLKHAIGVADSQLLDAAAQLDTTNCFPRSLMPKFRQGQGLDKRILPRLALAVLPLYGRRKTAGRSQKIHRPAGGYTIL